MLNIASSASARVHAHARMAHSGYSSVAAATRLCYSPERHAGPMAAGASMMLTGRHGQSQATRQFSTGADMKHISWLLKSIGGQREVKYWFEHYSGEASMSKPFAIIKVGGGVVESCAAAAVKSMSYISPRSVEQLK